MHTPSLDHKAMRALNKCTIPTSLGDSIDTLTTFLSKKMLAKMTDSSEPLLFLNRNSSKTQYPVSVFLRCFPQTVGSALGYNYLPYYPVFRGVGINNSQRQFGINTDMHPGIFPFTSNNYQQLCFFSELLSSCQFSSYSQCPEDVVIISITNLPSMQLLA